MRDGGRWTMDDGRWTADDGRRGVTRISNWKLEIGNSECLAAFHEPAGRGRATAVASGRQKAEGGRQVVGRGSGDADVSPGFETDVVQGVVIQEEPVVSKADLGQIDGLVRGK